jgi:hypothetical protein
MARGSVTRRMAELRDELAAVQREPVSAAVGYDGATGELELSFYSLGITSLAAEAATIGQPAEVAA